MAKKKRKNKNASIFPPELAKQDAGRAANPQMALASPADAAAMSAGYAGLGAVGSINEEVDKFLNDLRGIYWGIK
jgi:hypothetical protein